MAKARRLLCFAQFARTHRSSKRLEAMAAEIQSGRDDLAGRFRLRLRGVRRPAAAQAIASAAGVPHDGAEALARPSRHSADTLNPSSFRPTKCPPQRCVIALREQGRMADADQARPRRAACALGGGEEHRRSGDAAGNHRRLRPRRRSRDEGGEAPEGSPNARNTQKRPSPTACSAPPSSSSTASGSGARTGWSSSSASWRRD